MSDAGIYLEVICLFLLMYLFIYFYLLAARSSASLLPQEALEIFTLLDQNLGTRGKGRDFRS